MTTYHYLIDGITCINCTNAIENHLSQFRIHFSEIQSNAICQRVSVTFDNDELDSEVLKSEIAEYISIIGFDAEILENQIVQGTPPSSQKKIIENKKKLIRRYGIKGIIGVLSGISVMALMMFGMGLPLFVMFIIAAFSTLMTFYLGIESYKKIFYSFKTKNFNSMDLLFTISTSLMIILSLASFAFPMLPMMLDAPILIYGFRHIGKWIQEKAKKREIEQTSFRDRAPLFVKIVGKKDKVSLHTVKPGDIIIVQGGEIIPLDGICLTEKTKIITTIRDGATEPQTKIKGDTLLAGMRVPKRIPLIKMEVTKIESESNLACMENSLKKDDNDENKPKLQKIAENILKYFVPTVVTLALILGVSMSFAFSPVAAIQCAISILTSVCPCTFGLITPLAISMAKAKAVINGFQYTSGNALQKAKGIDRILCDLNGTLTKGKTTVIQTNIPDNMLRYLQAIESGKRNHLIGNALYKYAKSHSDTKEELVCKYTEKYRFGISANIHGQDFVIGNATQMRQNGFDIPTFNNETKDMDAKHLIYFAKNTEILGYAALDDPLRPEAKKVIHQLEKMGKKVYICTGSNKETALKYANKLGIAEDHIFHDCIPDSKNPTDKTKTYYVKKLKKEGYKVAMIGDGENDAFAVQESDFSIAIQSSASDPITRDLSDVIVQEGSLWPVITSFNIAKDAVNNVKQNLLMSLSYNLISVVVISVLFTTIGFALNPAFGALLMILQTIFILANAERFRRQAIPKPPSLKTSSDENHFTSSYGKMMLNTLRQKFSFHHDPPLEYTKGASKTLFNAPLPAPIFSYSPKEMKNTF